MYEGTSARCLPSARTAASGSNWEIKEYGEPVAWKASSSGVRRRGKAWQPRDHQLFARYDWCCVYHEGSAEAVLFRRSQIEKFGFAATASSLVASARKSLFESAQELTTPLRVDPYLFGLVPDHVVPKWIQDLLSERWTPEHRDLMQRDWIVAACGSCNGQRNQELESSQKLLYIFSRFVLPHRPGNEIERLQETFRFVEVLEVIENYRLANGIDEPLRPQRLARNAESETA